MKTFCIFLVNSHYTASPRMEEIKMTFKTNLKFIRLTIFIFSLPLLLFIALLITSYSDTGQLKWNKSVNKSSVFFGIVSLFTIPGFLLHYRYYFSDKGKSLLFHETYFDLNDRTGTNKIYYTDLIKVEKHYMFWNTRNPWRGYGYIKLFLKNGEILTYNCLTHDHISSAILFKVKKVQTEECEEIYPW